MAKTNFTSVDEYIASQPEASQSVLRRVRNTIRKSVPGADEGISYQIPTATAPLVAALKDELAPSKVNKGTIRFPLTGAVPAKLIERIAKLRAKEAPKKR